MPNSHNKKLAIFVEECFPLELKTIYNNILIYYKKGYRGFYVINYQHNANDECVLSALSLLKENHNDIYFNLIIPTRKDKQKQKEIAERFDVNNIYYPNDDDSDNFFLEDIDSILTFIVDEKPYAKDCKLKVSFG